MSVSEPIRVEAELTHVVLLDLVDVAVDRRVAEEGQHRRLAVRQLHHVSRVPLQCVRRRRGRLPQRPGAAGDVEHPQLVRHVGRLGLQLPAEHVDVVLRRRKEKDKFLTDIYLFFFLLI